MNLDCLIINPGNQQQVYQNLSQELTAHEPPLWANLIASYLRRKNISVEILDAEVFEMPPLDIAHHVAMLQPRLAVIAVYGHQPSASTQNMPAAVETSQAIRRYAMGIPILVVGGHPAALPEYTLIETNAHFVCTGEGPRSIAGIIERMHGDLKYGGTWWPNNFLDVPGLCLWKRRQPYDEKNPTPFNTRADSELFKTQPASNIQDLSEMPGDCWDLLPMDKYRAHIWHCLGEPSREPYASIYTTLGCPYACSFCCIQAPFKEGDLLKLHGRANSYRFWKPAHVIDQLTKLRVVYNVRNVKFADEMFVLNESHVNAICDGIIGRGLDLNIWAYARVDTIPVPGGWGKTHSGNLLAKMKKAGINWLALGIESASDHVRAGVDKADYSPVDIKEVCRVIREHGINIIGNFIFGLPDDDIVSMQETYTLAEEIMPEFVNMYPCMPYPGSALYEKTHRENPEALPPSWSAYSMHSYDSQPLPTKHLEAAKLLKFRDDALTCYLTNRKYQAMIEKKFGIEARQLVDSMGRMRLQRRLLGD